MNVTCLFEQSGTFKHAFERAGHNAIEQTNTICELMNKLGEDMNFKTIDDLKHNNKVLQEMIKVLKGVNK